MHTGAFDVATVDTAVGPFTVITEDDDVLAAGFTTDHQRLLDLVHPDLLPGGTDRPQPSHSPDVYLRPRLGGPVVAAVERYFDGDLTALDEVSLRFAGGDFQQRAWRAMREVPPGQVISYGELARRAGAEGWEAARAAGQACARNPNSLFVP